MKAMTWSSEPEIRDRLGPAFEVAGRVGEVMNAAVRNISGFVQRALDRLGIGTENIASADIATAAAESPVIQVMPVEPTEVQTVLAQALAEITDSRVVLAEAQTVTRAAANLLAGILVTNWEASNLAPSVEDEDIKDRLRKMIGETLTWQSARNAISDALHLTDIDSWAAMRRDDRELASQTPRGALELLTDVLPVQESCGAFRELATQSDFLRMHSDILIEQFRILLARDDLQPLPISERYKIKSVMNLVVTSIAFSREQEPKLLDAEYQAILNERDVVLAEDTAIRNLILEEGQGVALERRQERLEARREKLRDRETSLSNRRRLYAEQREKVSFEMVHLVLMLESMKNQDFWETTTERMKLLVKQMEMGTELGLASLRLKSKAMVGGEAIRPHEQLYRTRDNLWELRNLVEQSGQLTLETAAQLLAKLEKALQTVRLESLSPENQQWFVEHLMAIQQNVQRFYEEFGEQRFDATQINLFQSTREKVAKVVAAINRTMGKFEVGSAYWGELLNVRGLYNRLLYDMNGLVYQGQRERRRLLASA